VFDHLFATQDGLAGQLWAEMGESLGRPNPQRAELFRWYLRDGCVCFVAHSGSAIVAYVRMRYRPGLDDGLLIALGPGEVYPFELFVDENWRGRKIFAALGSRSRLFFKERGTRRLEGLGIGAPCTGRTPWRMAHRDTFGFCPSADETFSLLRYGFTNRGLMRLHPMVQLPESCALSSARWCRLPRLFSRVCLSLQRRVAGTPP
jgi:hypothetical protein